MGKRRGDDRRVIGRTVTAYAAAGDETPLLVYVVLNSSVERLNARARVMGFGGPLARGRTTTSQRIAEGLYWAMRRRLPRGRVTMDYVWG